RPLWLWSWRTPQRRHAGAAAGEPTAAAMEGVYRPRARRQRLPAKAGHAAKPGNLRGRICGIAQLRHGRLKGRLAEPPPSNRANVDRRSGSDLTRLIESKRK